MTFKQQLLAAAAITAPLLAAPAVAQPVTGLYIGAGIGANSRSNNTFTNTAFGSGSRELAYDWGYAGVLSMGWGFGNGFRAEVEGNFRQNNVSGFTNPSRGATANAGSNGLVRQYGVMANALYDFDLSALGVSPRTVMPYLGVGVGYGWTEFSRVNGRVGATGSSELHNNAGSIAAQGIAGLAFPLDRYVPGLAATMEYRFYWQDGGDRTSVNRATNVSSAFRLNESPSSYNHSAMVGLRYAFNRPAAPMVAPAPVPVQQTVARTYLVFFDWNRADLTDRARQIIADAASARSTVRSTRIEVSGHADTSGSAVYNQGLSVRRAEAVAAELTRRGVPRSEITIQGFGETRPLVATGDNVREPQNLRVEIVIR